MAGGACLQQVGEKQEKAPFLWELATVVSHPLSNHGNEKGLHLALVLLFYGDCSTGFPFY